MKSRRYKKAESLLQNSKIYSFKDAVKSLKESKSEKLDQIKVSFFLNSKGKKSQLSFRDFFKIPHVVNPVRVAVVESEFSSHFKDKLPGVSFLGIDDIREIVSKRNKKNWGFDKLFADSSAIPSIKAFSRKLSSKKCFPNSKEETIFKSENDVFQYLDGKTEIRSDKDGNFNFLLGRTSFEDFKIEQNYQTILNKIKSLKPVNWKGDYLKGITLSTAMGPGIKVSMQ